MNQLFNIFDTAEIPALLLCTPNKDELYSLPLAYEIKNTLRYNAISELEFSYPKSKDGETTTDIAYDYIKGKMLVLVEGVGYYIINECPEELGGGVPVKHVVCSSLEAEMLSRRLTGFNTVTLEDGYFLTVLQTVLDMIPTWTVGTIDSSLLLLNRRFSVSNSTIYNFLVTEMEKAYGCVFEFDPFDKTVSAISDIVPLPDTSIFLSLDNIVSKMEYKEITEELCTVLYCYGKGDLDIHNVNPLGTNAIYNFDYFKTSDWMSAGLISALDDWEDAVAIQQPIYAGKLTALSNLSNRMVTAQADMYELLSELQSMEDVREARIQQDLDTTQIDAEIAAQQITISSKEIDIATLQEKMDFYSIALRKIVHSLYFTTEISYENFADDVDNVGLNLDSFQKTWTDFYNDTSTYPGFDAAFLLAQTPTINQLIRTAQTDNRELVALLATGISSYPPAQTELDSLTQSIEDEITTLNTLYSLLQSIIPTTNITVTLNTMIIMLTAYLDIIAYSPNMTQAQYLELCSYMFENSYTNDNIVTVDTDTPALVQERSQDLYDHAVIVLAKTSIPRYEFSGEYSNFISLKEFSAFTEELELGKVITVKKDDNTTLGAALLELSITYDNPTDFSMTFSNRFRLDNSVFIYGDIFSSAAQISSQSNATPSVAGAVGGWAVSNASLSTPNAMLNSGSDAGSAVSNGGGYISFGPTPPEQYGNNVGVWLGYSGAPKISLYKNVNNYLQWTGSKLLIKAQNFTLDSLGNITATSATLSGEITATTGAIGGWVVTATALKDAAGVVGMSSAVTVGDDIRFWAGHATMASAPFRVTEAGALVATSATISGSITATSGTIGGFTVTSAELYAGTGATRVEMQAAGGFWAGATAIGDAPFSVTVAGVLTASSGAVGGWTLSTTDIHNAASTVKLRAAGNLAFGATPPTSATVGTGLFMDSTGLYGLATNVQQAIFSASTGKITAGANTVSLDVYGMKLTSTASDPTGGSEGSGGATAATTVSWVYNSLASMAIYSYYIAANDAVYGRIGVNGNAAEQKAYLSIGVQGGGALAEYPPNINFYISEAGAGTLTLQGDDIIVSPHISTLNGTHAGEIDLSSAGLLSITSGDTITNTGTITLRAYDNVSPSIETTDLEIGGQEVHISNSSGNAELIVEGMVGINDTTPSYDLDVNGSVRIVTSLGIGIPPTDAYGLYMTRTVTDLAAMSMRLSITNPTTVDSDISTYGILSYAYSEPATTKTSTGSVFGVYGYGANSGLGTVSGVYGVRAHGVITNGGIASNVYGFYGIASVAASGTATAAYGLNVSVANAGTITTGYGVYVGTVEGSTEYGVYQSDVSNRNVFLGTVGMGSGATEVISDLDVGSATGAVLTLRRNDAGVSAADVIGTLQWHANDTQLTTQNIVANIVVTASGAMSTDAARGKMVFSVTGTTAGGSPLEHMAFLPTTVAAIGFFGATPTPKGTAFTQTYSTAAHTITQTAMTDPAAYGAGANGYSTAAMASAVHAEVIALKANMVVTQNVLNGLIDDLQLLGLV
jgi:hypothetical protein